jgi:glutamate--cysteine ligase
MHAFGGSRAPHPDRVGLEVELVPIVMREGAPRVADATHVLSQLRRIGRDEGWSLERINEPAPLITLPDGAIITLEPGGQIEYSSAALEDPVAALDAVDRFVELLVTPMAEAGIELRASGFNDACAIEDIPLQLTAPRYREMDAYFDAIGPYGREMMRATCALQVSLDFGEGAVAAERWRLANMIAPAMNALFARSAFEREGRRFASYRYEIWRHVDPTRTGRLFDEPDLDPVADYLRFALDARVMMIRVDRDERRRPAEPMTFRQWLDGSEVYGYPDMEDWELHLTTLFPDVRARGFMEVRSIDAQESDGRRAAVGLLTALLYDDTLRHAALARLESRRRTRRSDEHEHDGFWSSDLATGRELLELALPSIDARLRKYCIEIAERSRR